MRRAALAALLVPLILAGGIAYAVKAVRASLPVLDGTVALAELGSPVAVTFDGYGIPTIVAASRADALRTLGYVTACDRLFQMDLLRRSSAGKLAEVFGDAARDADIKQRTIGFQQAANAILHRLPQDQRAALEAYAQGVNQAISQMERLPFEFLLLGYKPEPWRMEDSLLIVLGMFQMLSLTDDDERMRTVMAQTLPAEVVTFLVPETDHYTSALLSEKGSDNSPSAIPVQALAALRRQTDRPASQTQMVRLKQVGVGSNAWAVNGNKTTDGRAILANDMHLDVAVPNLWYRVQLRYDDVDLTGMVVPGVPVVVVGTNRYVAWGMTNVEGDFLDLVQLDIHDSDANQYRTPTGWRRFETRREVIAIKGGADVQVDVKDTIWGPVAQQSLLGHSVAVHWIPLDPHAVDLGLLDMDRARSLRDGIDVMNRASGPANNVILTDADGHIGWTYTGKIPIRRGFDGAVSVSWADGRSAWTGYVTPNDLPRIVDPPSGFVVSANNRMVGREYPYVIGHGFVNGYRAYRITERLQAMRDLKEADLFKLQLDTTSGFYEFYQRIALQTLNEAAVRDTPELLGVRRAIETWHGEADDGSIGFSLLVRFRDVLAQSLFEQFLWPCRDRERTFSYSGDLDTPMRALLIEQVPQLLPEPERFSGWPAFLLNALKESVHQLKKENGSAALDGLRWGHMNRVHMTHPLAGTLPGLHRLLDMPEDEQAGCGECVRVMSGSLTASQRLVVSPGRHDLGILHMPGGQSGHPLSPHYRDQQRFWSEGIPLPLSAGLPIHTLTLVPSHAVRSGGQPA